MFSFSTPKSDRKAASEAFDCPVHRCKPFFVADPFQNGICLEGFKCSREGKMGGSLFLTHVDGVKLDSPQIIYGTPALAYPYTPQSWKNKNKAQNKNVKETLPKSSVKANKKHETRTQEEEEDEATLNEPIYNESLLQHSHKNLRFLSSFHPKTRRYYLANKYNGSNILFFKYFDHEGQLRISAKTKGSATVNDTPYGAFLGLTFQALGLPKNSALDVHDDETFPSILSPLLNEGVQGLCFELCGQLEPHLVDYAFEIALKPLFEVWNDGSISPIISQHSINHVKCTEWLSLNNLDSIAFVDGFGPYEFTNALDVVAQCKALQEMSQECNNQFRRRTGRKLKYEYNHFATEGFVLYLLDSDDRVVPSRTMYKIKPIDIEEVHWGKFDEQREFQVIEAVKKMVMREKPLNIQSLREELDIGEKEWGKFGRDIQKFIDKKHLFREPLLTSRKKKKKRSKKNTTSEEEAEEGEQDISSTSVA